MYRVFSQIKSLNVKDCTEHTTKVEADRFADALRRQIARSVATLPVRVPTEDDELVWHRAFNMWAAEHPETTARTVEELVKETWGADVGRFVATSAVVIEWSDK